MLPLPFVWAAINLRQSLPPPAVPASVGQIADSPNGFYGRRVLLTTVVHRVLGPHGFTAGNGALLNNAELASWAGKPAVIATNVNPFR